MWEEKERSESRKEGEKAQKKEKGETLKQNKEGRNITGCKRKRNRDKQEDRMRNLVSLGLNESHLPINPCCHKILDFILLLTLF